MNHKTCLVTGANSGIGEEIALGLAIQGAHVIMVCRNAAKGEQSLAKIKARSGSNTIDLIIADLSSQIAIHALAKKIHEHYKNLDVLINNAGIVLKDKTLSVDGIEMTLATNHLAPFLLTYLLQDTLKASHSARIINVSSAIHKWAALDLSDLQFERRKYRFMKAYAQSKLLINLMTFEWARKFAGTNVSVNCIHPGAVKTHLGSDKNYPLLFRVMDKLIKSFFITPKKAAKAIVHLATSPDLESVTGKYFIKEKESEASATSYDEELAKKAWEASMLLVVDDVRAPVGV